MWRKCNSCLRYINVRGGVRGNRRCYFYSRSELLAQKGCDPKTKCAIDADFFIVHRYPGIRFLLRRIPFTGREGELGLRNTLLLYCPATTTSLFPKRYTPLNYRRSIDHSCCAFASNLKEKISTRWSHRYINASLNSRILRK